VPCFEVCSKRHCCAANVYLVGLRIFCLLFIYFDFCTRKIHGPVTFIYQQFRVVQDFLFKLKSRENITEYIEAKRNRSEFLSTKMCFRCALANCEKPPLASSCLSVCPHGISRLPRKDFFFNLIFNTLAKNGQENSSCVKI